MAQPTKSRRRRGQRGPAATKTNGSATTLLSQVSELVEESRALTRENKQLTSIIARVGLAVRPITSRPAQASQGSGSPQRSSASKANGHPRQRRRITDPASLERRRAALAKARQVLAERRATRKAG